VFEPLGGMDAAFLGLETPSSQMHVLGVFLLEDVEEFEPLDFQTFKAILESRMGKIPFLTRKLAEVPLGLYRPAWVQDESFELDAHLTRAALPSPGGLSELEEFVARVASQPLDRRRPLWEMFFVEGFQATGRAVVIKVHHAAVDGVAAAQLAMSFLDLEPGVRPPPRQTSSSAPIDHEFLADVRSGWEEPASPLDEDRAAGSSSQPGGEVISYALKGLASVPSRLARSLLTSAGELLAWGASVQEAPGQRRSLPFKAPRTSLNGEVGRLRRTSFVSLPMKSMNAVRERSGSSLNEVLLALCSGALREYLLDKGELPTEPLVALVPVSLRLGDRQSGSDDSSSEDPLVPRGNQLSALFVALATEVADPVERLRCLSSEAREAKEKDSSLVASLLSQWSDLIPPVVASGAMKLASTTGAFEKLRPIVNVTISNVPGPGFPLYAGGSRVRDIFPLGPVMDGIGLNITVLSYLDVMEVGVTASRELVKDPEKIAEGIKIALDELCAAFEIEGPGAHGW
jgi:diacylglycerol O-acyltransferase